MESSFDYAKKIGALIAMAEDESLAEEARASYRLKAEELMRKYRIAEEDALAKDETSLAPVWKTITLVEFGAERSRHSDMSQKYIDLWKLIAKHAGVRTKVKYAYASEEDGSSAAYVAETVGFDIDVRLAEFIWTAARLVFLVRIDPVVNSELSDAENAYYLRNAGYQRNQIAQMLWGSDLKDGAAHGKVQKLYLAECAKRSEKPSVQGRGTNAAEYRKAYASSFVDNFGYRLRAARDAADKEGGALVLSGRKTKVDEAFYEKYPDARPMSAEEKAKREEEQRAYWEALAAAERACTRCAALRAKKGITDPDDSEGKCRTHRPQEWTAAMERRWQAKYNSPAARAGQRNGAEAARAVNLERSGGARTARAEGSDRKAIG